MKKLSFIKKALCAAIIIVAQSAFAAVPVGYYSKIDGEKKASLKAQLKSCIASHTVLSYSSLWEHYEETDVVPGTQKQVFDYYSPEVYYFTGNGTSPSGANKEHSCPQSWWGKGASCNAYSDLFNVLPSEATANSAKSNYPVGETGGSLTYSNGRIKVGQSKRSEYQGKVFEPADEHKGDFARIYFYIATIYSSANWQTTGSIPCAFVQEDYPTIKSQFIQMLLEWNRQDPVDEWEIGRQERVYSHQHNRNPFIDYPQLAEYIWGDSTEYAFDLQHAILNLDMSGSEHGGTGSDVNPGDNPGGDNPGGGNDSTVVVPPSAGTLFSESFAEITAGNNYSNQGSNEAWPGNDNFPEVSAAYKAGGAVKLGSSKKNGSLASRTIPFEGGTLGVTILVKGWTNVEGDLKVSLSGAEPKTASYEATMSDDFEEVYLQFEHVSANPTLIITTTEKRAFIDDVTVFVPATESLLNLSGKTLSNQEKITDLLGRKVLKPVKGGIYLQNGKKTIFTH